MHKFISWSISLCIMATVAYLSIPIAATASRDVLPDTITVDFLDLKTVPENKNVQFGHKYVMQIENLNLSIFKVENMVSQKDNNDEMPCVLKDIALPSYFNFIIPKSRETKVTAISNNLMGGTRSSVPGTKKDGKRTVPKKNYDSLIINNIKIIKYSNNRVFDAIKMNAKMKHLFGACGKTYNDIQKEADSYLVDYLKTDKTRVNSFGNSITNSERDTLVKSLKIYLEQVIQNAITAGEALDTLAPQSIGIYPEIVKTAKTTVGEIQKFRDENKIQDLIDNYNMFNYYNFTFISKPIKIEADEIKYDIKISADKLLPYNMPASRYITETYKTKGGPKIDFSTGAFGSWGGQDLYGRELIYKEVNDSVVTIQAKDGGTRALLSIGALMHIYCRSGGNINWAISPGISTTTDFKGMNYHLGGSVLFGSKNRLVITLGAILREANILDRNYSYNTQYLKKDLPDSPPLIKAFPQWGVFLGLTYNYSRYTAQ